MVEMCKKQMNRRERSDLYPKQLLILLERTLDGRLSPEKVEGQKPRPRGVLGAHVFQMPSPVCLTSLDVMMLGEVLIPRVAEVRVPSIIKNRSPLLMLDGTLLQSHF